MLMMYIILCWEKSNTLYSLAQVCVLRGCSVYNSFFTVIGEQMTLRRLVFSPCFVTLQAVTVMLCEVKNVCKIHSRVQPCPANEYLLLFNYFSILVLLGFTPLSNISCRQRRFLHWAWKARQILLRGSNFGLRFFYVPQIYDTGSTTIYSFRRKSYSGFLRYKKKWSTPAGFEPANLGSSGEYDNHWTTGVD